MKRGTWNWREEAKDMHKTAIIKTTYWTERSFCALFPFPFSLVCFFFSSSSFNLRLHLYASLSLSLSLSLRHGPFFLCGFLERFFLRFLTLTRSNRQQTLLLGSLSNKFFFFFLILLLFLLVSNFYCFVGYLSRVVIRSSPVLNFNKIQFLVLDWNGPD